MKDKNNNLSSEFGKKLFTLSEKRRKNPKEIFDDFIEFNYFASIISMGTYCCSNDGILDFRDRDKSYAEVMGYILQKYGNDKDLFVELSTIYSKLVKTAKPFEDVLGMIYDEHLGKILGQFLTPPDLASFIGTMMFNSPYKGGWIADPTGCGAGGLLLGGLRALYEKEGIVGTSKIKVYGLDIDERMSKLAFVQIAGFVLYHKIPISEIWFEVGNTLLVEKELLVHVVFPKAEKLANEIIKYRESILDYFQAFKDIA